MSTIHEVINHLENIAPLRYQESYDNAGLITGSAGDEVSGVLICLDSTEEILDEAIEKKCNLVIAHHPIIFSGLKKITGANYVERVVIKAIKNDIAIYAAHTNLDNVSQGVNKMIAEKLGLKNVSILSPKKNLLKKLVTFVPVAEAEKVRHSLFNAGAGHIGNYDECSFNTEGFGTFRAGNNTNPFVGKIGEQHREKEARIEVIFEAVHEDKILDALFTSHPYEEAAYDLYPLDNSFHNTGSGMIGEIETAMNEELFLRFLKSTMQTACIRYSAFTGNTVKRVAVCGGSGSFLLKDAITSEANIFVTADFKYHQFFDAERKILIADIGHYESEQFTKDLFYRLLKENFSTFAIHLSEINTNPVNYF